MRSVLTICRNYGYDSGSKRPGRNEPDHFCLAFIMAGAPKGILSPEGDRRPAGGRGYGFAFLYPIPGTA